MVCDNLTVVIYRKALSIFPHPVFNHFLYISIKTLLMELIIYSNIKYYTIIHLYRYLFCPIYYKKIDLFFSNTHTY